MIGAINPRMVRPGTLVCRAINPTRTTALFTSHQSRRIHAFKEYWVKATAKNQGKTPTTNSGQGVDLVIYYLPLQITSFLREMQQAQYRDDWSGIVRRAWQVAPPSKKKAKPETEDFQPRRNHLYEDLFGLPGNAHAFLRTYFLRVALRYARADQGDPRGGYSLQTEVSLVSWKITARFLKRIMNMEKERIEAIRKMGDQLAEYVNGENDRRFFRDFFWERRYGEFRTALIKANIAYVRRGKPPIITLDPYIEVFEEGDEVARADWQLARDLVLIRMICA